MSKNNNWSVAHRDASEKQHRKEVAGLRQQLDHATAQIERMEQSRKSKIIIATPARKRGSGDIVRVIIPDTHGAKASKVAIEALLSDIKAINPQEIIMTGDHVDCGGHLALHHVLGYVAETAYSYEDDLASANAFLDSLRLAAPSAKIEYIEGNHERRVETWCVTMTLRHGADSEGLRKLYAPEFRLNLKERGIPYYRDSVCHDGLQVPGIIKRGKCYFFHGFNISKHATSATVEKIAGNCVFGDTHRVQSDVVVKVGVGVIGAWNPGCLCERQPLWQHTNPTEWTHGYGLQLVTANEDFLHLNIPIIDGRSLFGALVKL
jgi:Calcineurin-like phosphoesterase